MNRNFNPSSIAKWKDTKSRVMGDYQARFCERFGGETPPYLLDPCPRLPSPATPMQAGGGAGLTRE